MLNLSKPQIVERGPYLVVGAYHTYEGQDEGPGWEGASRAFFSRTAEIENRSDDLTLGFLYRPHQDHPQVAESVRACFVGVEVTDLDHVPGGMSTTRFSGGKYVIVECRGETESEAAMGVGEAIEMLEKWIPDHGYAQGDACFACSPPRIDPPPYIEWVYYKIEEQQA